MDHHLERYDAQKDDSSGFWRTRYALGLVVIGAVAVYFLLTEHLAHVVGALPYVLLLACPLMHLFMHHGHGGHGHHHSDEDRQHDQADTAGKHQPGGTP